MTSGEKHYLPFGWRLARLGDLGVFQSGGTPRRGVSNYYGGDIPWAKIEDLTRAGMWIGSTEESITDFALRETSVRVFPPGTVLFAMYGSIGNCSIAKISMATNQAIISCKCGPELLPEFLWLWFSFSKFHLLELGRGGTQANLNAGIVKSLTIPLPPVSEQRRIFTILNEQLVAVERARAAAEEQIDLTYRLIVAYLNQSLSTRPLQKLQLKDCLVEVKQGVGDRWKDYPVIGATRAGVAPAKENVGKQPERYKLVEPGIIFYNPMRINIGSIGMLDEGDLPGITSPDYVVFKTLPGVLHYRWFYYWFRSPYGEAFIKTMARGAVRERIMFNRLAMGEIEAPSWDIQGQIAEKLRKTEDMRRAIFEQIEVINAFPKLLLRRAFNGEL